MTGREVIHGDEPLPGSPMVTAEADGKVLEAKSTQRPVSLDSGCKFSAIEVGRLRQHRGDSTRSGRVCTACAGIAMLPGCPTREPSASPNWMDRIQLVAVASALVLDLMVLGTMIARIGELGFTPNRTAALGLNLVLLVNLAGAAWLSARFLTGRSRLHRLERWQTTYLPAFALWAATVVVVLPPLFAFE
jgi:hypothetical protein